MNEWSDNELDELRPLVAALAALQREEPADFETYIGERLSEPFPKSGSSAEKRAWLGRWHESMCQFIEGQLDFMRSARQVRAQLAEWRAADG